MATVDEINAQILRALDPRQYVNAMREALDIVRGEEMSFPPQSDRQRSNHFNTWMREVGRLPLSAFLKTVRTRQGTYQSQRKRISTKTILKPSEKMLQKWKQAPVVVALNGDYLVGVMANTASYSGYVQGEKQPDFHKETGWLTTKEAADKHREKIAQRFVRRGLQILNGEQIT